MNEELNKIIIESIKGTVGLAGNVIEQFKVLAPEIVHEIVARELMQRSVSAIGSIAVVVILYKIIMKLFIAVDKSVSKYDCEFEVIGMVVCTIGGILFSLTAFSEISRLLSIWVAPKLFVLEYLQHLLK